MNEKKIMEQMVLGLICRAIAVVDTIGYNGAPFPMVRTKLQSIRGALKPQLTLVKLPTRCNDDKSV